MRNTLLKLINFVLDTATDSFFEGTTYPHPDNETDHVTIESLKRDLNS